MQTHFLFDVLEGYKPFEQMVQESQKSGAVIAASGMAGAQKAHAACALAARTGRPLLFLCDSERSATQTMEDLSALLGGGVSPCSPHGKSPSIRMWRPAARWPTAALRRCARF